MKEKPAMSGWRIVPLPDARLTAAWPLVCLRYPSWTLDTWLGEARTLLAEEGPAGLLAAETAAGYIYAVCGFMVDTSGPGPAELSLPIAASIRWRGANHPLERLLATVEFIGRRHGCRSVRTAAPVSDAPGDTEQWKRFGYEWCGEVLHKRFPTGRALPQPTL